MRASERATIERAIKRLRFHYEAVADELQALLDTPPDPERDIERRLCGVVERLRKHGKAIAKSGSWGWGVVLDAADEIEACLSAPETSVPEEAPAQIESASGRVSYADGKPEGRDTAAPVDDREQVERVAEWLYNNDSATGGSWPPATTRPENVEYWRDKARELLALLDRTSVPTSVTPVTPADKVTGYDAEGKPEGRDTAAADREQGEARYSQEKIVELLRKGVEGHKKQAALMLGTPAAIRSEGAADALEAAANIIERGPAPLLIEKENKMAEWPEKILRGRKKGDEPGTSRPISPLNSADETLALGIEVRTYIPEGEVSEDSGKQLRDFKASGGALRVSEDSVRVSRDLIHKAADHLRIAQHEFQRETADELFAALTDQGRGDGE